MRKIFSILLLLTIPLITGGWLYVGSRPLNMVQEPPPAGANRTLQNTLARNMENGTQRILEHTAPVNPGSTTKAADRHTVVVTGWTNPSNAYGTSSDSIYATATPAKNSTISGDFGWPALTDGELPVGATITSVVVEVMWKVSTQASDQTFGVQIYNDGSAIGTETIDTTEPLTNTVRQVSVTTGITESDLKTAGLIRARVRTTRAKSNTSVTCSLDYVKMTVNYLY